jgi:hypothetical protein
MADTKKRVYLAVRKKTSDVTIDPFNGYLTDKSYLNSKDGLYLNKEEVADEAAA